MPSVARGRSSVGNAGPEPVVPLSGGVVSLWSMGPVTTSRLGCAPGVWAISDPHVTWDYGPTLSEYTSEDICGPASVGCCPGWEPGTDGVLSSPRWSWIL